MTSSEVLGIVGESIQEIASLLDTSMSEYEMMLDGSGADTLYYQKGYSAAIHDVTAIISRMAAKFGVESE